MLNVSADVSDGLRGEGSQTWNEASCLNSGVRRDDPKLVEPRGEFLHDHGGDRSARGSRPQRGQPSSRRTRYLEPCSAVARAPVVPADILADLAAAPPGSASRGRETHRAVPREGGMTFEAGAWHVDAGSGTPSAVWQCTRPPLRQRRGAVGRAAMPGLEKTACRVGPRPAGAPACASTPRQYWRANRRGVERSETPRRPGTGHARRNRSRRCARRVQDSSETQ